MSNETNNEPKMNHTVYCGPYGENAVLHACGCKGYDGYEFKPQCWTVCSCGHIAQEHNNV